MLIVYMVLPEDFRKKFRHFIEDEIASIEQHDFEVERHKSMWKYQNAWDFMYGQEVGFLYGSLMGYWEGKKGKSPTDEEIVEMNELVEEHASQLRETLEKYWD